MGDGLKLSKDKRHRSSSSIAAVVLEGTRSERKLDIRASIPEVDDQFALAEARCDDLQQKIELVKGLKRKRKLKKRSMTRVNEPPPPETIPLITVRTQPKKKMPQQALRPRRLEGPSNPTRSYLDPATVEQRRMLGQVRGYNRDYKPQLPEEQLPLSKPRPRRAHADGDSIIRLGAHVANAEVACGDDDVVGNCSDHDYNRHHEEYTMPVNKTPRVGYSRQLQKTMPVNHRRHVPRDTVFKDENNDTAEPAHNVTRTGATPSNRRRSTNVPKQQAAAPVQHEERPVVELFNKNRSVHSVQSGDLNKRHNNVPEKGNKAREINMYDQSVDLEEDDALNETKDKERRQPRRVKYRSRRYELPTVASQMKQAGTRYFPGIANHTNIPFIISKSTAPSHNIGVNIQQVLNGLKIQQPLSGIPLTIAYHMGLGHIPTYETRNVRPSLDNREINAIRLGRRLLRLPSYKYMSYNRFLNLYRESDGLVSRFLRAINRPHYFYTSMYNLATREDFDATGWTKGRINNQEAKQSLAEYASLYREYEQLEKRLKETHDPELERRKDELARELAVREDHIRRVVQEYRPGPEPEQTPLRASASTAEDAYRYSTLKLNVGDAPQ